MSVAPVNPGLYTAIPRLLIADPRLEVRTSQYRSEQAGAAPSESPAALQRIERLITKVRDDALQALERSGSQASTSLQQTIDRNLAEISSLLGTRFAFGGKKHAIIEGLNEKQISSYEIRTLRPNASANFTGSLERKQRGASVLIDSRSLLESGGSLQLDTLSRKRTIQFQAGTSLHQLTRKINSASRLGVKARRIGDALEISTLKRGKQASLRVVAQQGQTGSSLGPPNVTGLDPTQITALDTSNLTPGAPITVNGSRDTLATTAEITYEGSPGALIAGSASFQLTGLLGSANFSINQGEALADVAQRINDQSGDTGAEAIVVADNLSIRSLAKGAAATLTLENIVPAAEITVNGANAAQVDGIAVVSIPDDTTIVLNGDVTLAADTASQVYHGDVGGFVADSATFTLSGLLGSAQISISAGESLVDVAGRINDLSATTGVAASTSGDDLTFESIDVGSAANVQVTLESVTQYIDVTSVNASQIENFQVVSAEPDSVNSLSGSVTQAATQGQLTYTGFLGATTSAASFSLTGDLGSATVDVNTLQSLTSVRDAINSESINTGIAATVSGDVLTLTSNSYGSAAVVEVDVTSGTFNTNGGDGNGNAVGLDAQLAINGNSVTASGNDVAYSDSLGSYTFRLVDGFSGTFDTVNITSADGAFDVSGGNGSGTAYGIDAEATINGQLFVAAGNDFSLNVASASFLLSVVDGFTGSLDPITIASSPAEFTITGADGNGLATGTDGSATVNGELLTSSTNTFNIDSAGGLLTLTFADGFLGGLQEVTISYEAVDAVNTQSFSSYSTGSNARAVFNGALISSKGKEYVIQHNGVEIAVQFAKGFQGEIDPFSITAGGIIEVTPSAQPLTGSLRSGAQQALSELYSLATGGEQEVRTEGSASALSIAFDALANLQSLGSGSNRLGRRSLTGRVIDQLF